MADVDTFASPQSHSAHQTYRRLGRVRHSRQFEEFLTVQATRLSTTAAAIFALLDSYTADQIKATASVGALPSANAEHGHK